MIIMPRSNDAVLRDHSLTRAAEQLDTTQPTISKVLARLRGQFGDPLLVRDGHLMRPTPRATEIIAPLRALLQAADGIRRPLRAPFDPATSERRFRLLLSDVGMILFAPPLTARLAAAGPGLTLEAVPLDSRHFEAKLASGEADLALGVFPGAPRGLRRQPLYVDRYASVARRTHPDLRRLRTAAGFRRARHVIVAASDTGHGAHEVVQDALDAALAPETVLLRLPSFVAAAVVASQSDGVATVPANLARALAGLQLAGFRPPIAIPPIPVAQYWHERYQRDPGHRWLRETCFALFARA
jgi:DNA-binding transcriptional LysR family regulator